VYRLISRGGERGEGEEESATFQRNLEAKGRHNRRSGGGEGGREGGRVETVGREEGEDADSAEESKGNTSGAATSGRGRDVVVVS
jgi:hypothetical protein